MKKTIFSLIFMLLTFSLIFFPMFLPENMIYIVKAKSTYYPWFNIYMPILMYFMVLLFANYLYKIGGKLFEYLIKP